MATPETDQDEQVQEADRRNGEPDATDPRIGHHDDALLDEHPHAGQMPSDVNVQAERQEPLDE